MTTDFKPLLRRAIAANNADTLDKRRPIYDRARTALVNQLRAIVPPLSESEIVRERLSLETAIREVDGEMRAVG